MKKIIQFTNYNNKYAKGEKMEKREDYKKFLEDIRKKPHSIEDMPDRAKDVLEFFQIDDFSSGVPIVRILTNLGFGIFQSNLEPSGLSAYIAVSPKFESVYGASKITCVNSNDNGGHKRFALAHELGHYLFDFDDNKTLNYYNTYFVDKDDDNPSEKRVNKFAANLLMPKNMFLDKYNEYKKLQSKADIVNALSKYFIVSSTAILKRFCELGIKEFGDNMGI